MVCGGASWVSSCTRLFESVGGVNLIFFFILRRGNFRALNCDNFGVGGYLN